MAVSGRKRPLPLVWRGIVAMRAAPRFLLNLARFDRAFQIGERFEGRSCRPVRLHADLGERGVKLMPARILLGSLAIATKRKPTKAAIEIAVEASAIQKRRPL